MLLLFFLLIKKKRKKKLDNTTELVVVSTKEREKYGKYKKHGKAYFQEPQKYILVPYKTFTACRLKINAVLYSRNISLKTCRPKDTDMQRIGKEVFNMSGLPLKSE